MTGEVAAPARRGGPRAAAVAFAASLALLIVPTSGVGAASAATPPVPVGPGILITSAEGGGSAGAAVADRARRPRIVGGNTTTISAWPWQTALTLSPALYGGNAAARQICGGSLVTPRIVITAAHCVYGRSSFLPASEFAVVTGRTRLSSGEGQEIPVSRIHRFVDASNRELYNPNTSEWDVVLLELASSSTAGTIKLAGPGERDLWAGGRTAFVTGWGSTVPSGGGYPDDLRVAQVRIFSDAECPNWLGGLFKPSVMVCAGAPPSRDTCDGDSGGPLVVPAPAGGFRLVGDTSFGLNEPCGRSPSAYGRLAADPIRSSLRNAVISLTGIDIVAGGGSPPPGPTLTRAQSKLAAWDYSERACLADRRCRRYWAGRCTATTGGFTCQARNYERRRGGRRSTCKRKVSVALTGGTVVASPLGRWSCRRGWRRALDQRSIRPGIKNG